MPRRDPLDEELTRLMLADTAASRRMFGRRSYGVRLEAMLRQHGAKETCLRLMRRPQTIEWLTDFWMRCQGIGLLDWFYESAVEARMLSDPFRTGLFADHPNELAEAQRRLNSYRSRPGRQGACVPSNAGSRADVD